MKDGKKIKVKIISKESGQILYSWQDQIVDDAYFMASQDERQINIIVNEGKEYEW